MRALIHFLDHGEKANATDFALPVWHSFARIRFLITQQCSGSSGIRHHHHHHSSTSMSSTARKTAGRCLMVFLFLVQFFWMVQTDNREEARQAERREAQPDEATDTEEPAPVAPAHEGTKGKYLRRAPGASRKPTKPPIAVFLEHFAEAVFGPPTSTTTAKSSLDTGQPTSTGAGASGARRASSPREENAIPIDSYEAAATYLPMRGASTTRSRMTTNVAAPATTVASKENKERKMQGAALLEKQGDTDIMGKPFDDPGGTGGVSSASSVKIDNMYSGQTRSAASKGHPPPSSSQEVKRSAIRTTRPASTVLDTDPKDDVNPTITPAAPPLEVDGTRASASQLTGAPSTSSSSVLQLNAEQVQVGPPVEEDESFDLSGATHDQVHGFVPFSVAHGVSEAADTDPLLAQDHSFVMDLKEKKLLKEREEGKALFPGDSSKIEEAMNLICPPGFYAINSEATTAAAKEASEGNGGAKKSPTKLLKALGFDDIPTEVTNAMAVYVKEPLLSNRPLICPKTTTRYDEEDKTKANNGIIVNYVKDKDARRKRKALSVDKRNNAIVTCRLSADRDIKKASLEYHLNDNSPLRLRMTRVKTDGDLKNPLRPADFFPIKYRCSSQNYEAAKNAVAPYFKFGIQAGEDAFQRYRKLKIDGEQPYYVDLVNSEDPRYKMTGSGASSTSALQVEPHILLNLTPGVAEQAHKLARWGDTVKGRMDAQKRWVLADHEDIVGHSKKNQQNGAVPHMVVYLPAVVPLRKYKGKKVLFSVALAGGGGGGGKAKSASAALQLGAQEGGGGADEGGADKEKKEAGGDNAEEGGQNKAEKAEETKEPEETSEKGDESSKEEDKKADEDTTSKESEAAAQEDDASKKEENGKEGGDEKKDENSAAPGDDSHASNDESATADKNKDSVPDAEETKSGNAEAEDDSDITKEKGKEDRGPKKHLEEEAHVPSAPPATGDEVRTRAENVISTFPEAEKANVRVEVVPGVNGKGQRAQVYADKTYFLTPKVRDAIGKEFDNADLKYAATKLDAQIQVVTEAEGPSSEIEYVPTPDSSYENSLDAHLSDSSSVVIRAVPPSELLSAFSEEERHGYESIQKEALTGKQVSMASGGTGQCNFQIADVQERFQTKCSVALSPSPYVGAVTDQDEKAAEGTAAEGAASSLQLRKEAIQAESEGKAEEEGEPAKKQSTPDEQPRTFSPKEADALKQFGIAIDKATKQPKSTRILLRMAVPPGGSYQRDMYRVQSGMSAKSEIKGQARAAMHQKKLDELLAIALKTSGEKAIEGGSSALQASELGLRSVFPDLVAPQLHVLNVEQEGEKFDAAATKFRVGLFRNPSDFREIIAEHAEPSFQATLPSSVFVPYKVPHFGKSKQAEHTTKWFRSAPVAPPPDESGEGSSNLQPGDRVRVVGYTQAGAESVNDKIGIVKVVPSNKNQGKYSVALLKPPTEAKTNDEKTRLGDSGTVEESGTKNEQSEGSLEDVIQLVKSNLVKLPKFNFQSVATSGIEVEPRDVYFPDSDELVQEAQDSANRELRAFREDMNGPRFVAIAFSSKGGQKDLLEQVKHKLEKVSLTDVVSGTDTETTNALDVVEDRGVISIKKPDSASSSSASPNLLTGDECDRIIEALTGKMDFVTFDETSVERTGENSEGEQEQENKENTPEIDQEKRKKQATLSAGLVKTLRSKAQIGKVLQKLDLLGSLDLQNRGDGVYQLQKSADFSKADPSDAQKVQKELEKDDESTAKDSYGKFLLLDGRGFMRSDVNHRAIIITVDKKTGKETHRRISDWHFFRPKNVISTSSAHSFDHDEDEHEGRRSSSDANGEKTYIVSLQSGVRPEDLESEFLEGVPFYTAKKISPALEVDMPDVHRLSGDVVWGEMDPDNPGWLKMSTPRGVRYLPKAVLRPLIQNVEDMPAADTPSSLNEVRMGPLRGVMNTRPLNDRRDYTLKDLARDVTTMFPHLLQQQKKHVLAIEDKAPKFKEMAEYLRARTARLKVLLQGYKSKYAKDASDVVSLAMSEFSCVERNKRIREEVSMYWDHRQGTTLGHLLEDSPNPPTSNEEEEFVREAKNTGEDTGKPEVDQEPPPLPVTTKKSSTLERRERESDDGTAVGDGTEEDAIREVGGKLLQAISGAGGGSSTSSSTGGGGKILAESSTPPVALAEESQEPTASSHMSWNFPNSGTANKPLTVSTQKLGKSRGYEEAEVAGARVGTHVEKQQPQAKANSKAQDHPDAPLSDEEILNSVWMNPGEEDKLQIEREMEAEGGGRTTSSASSDHSTSSTTASDVEVPELDIDIAQDDLVDTSSFLQQQVVQRYAAQETEKIDEDEQILRSLGLGDDVDMELIRGSVTSENDDHEDAFYNDENKEFADLRDVLLGRAVVDAPNYIADSAADLFGGILAANEKSGKRLMLMEKDNGVAPGRPGEQDRQHADARASRSRMKRHRYKRTPSAYGYESAAERWSEGDDDGDESADLEDSDRASIFRSSTASSSSNSFLEIDDPEDLDHESLLQLDPADLHLEGATGQRKSAKAGLVFGFAGGLMQENEDLSRGQQQQPSSTSGEVATDVDSFLHDANDESDTDLDDVLFELSEPKPQNRQSQHTSVWFSRTSALQTAVLAKNAPSSFLEERQKRNKIATRHHRAFYETDAGVERGDTHDKLAKWDPKEKLTSLYDKWGDFCTDNYPKEGQYAEDSVNFKHQCLYLPPVSFRRIPQCVSTTVSDAEIMQLDKVWNFRLRRDKQTYSQERALDDLTMQYFVIKNDLKAIEASMDPEKAKKAFDKENANKGWGNIFKQQVMKSYANLRDMGYGDAAGTNGGVVAVAPKVDFRYQPAPLVKNVLSLLQTDQPGKIVSQNSYLYQMGAFLVKHTDMEWSKFVCRQRPLMTKSEFREFYDFVKVNTIRKRDRIMAKNPYLTGEEVTKEAKGGKPLPDDIDQMDCPIPITVEVVGDFTTSDAPLETTFSMNAFEKTKMKDLTKYAIQEFLYRNPFLKKQFTSGRYRFRLYKQEPVVSEGKEDDMNDEEIVDEKALSEEDIVKDWQDLAGLNKKQQDQVKLEKQQLDNKRTGASISALSSGEKQERILANMEDFSFDEDRIQDLGETLTDLKLGPHSVITLRALPKKPEASKWIGPEGDQFRPGDLIVFTKLPSDAACGCANVPMELVDVNDDVWEGRQWVVKRPSKKGKGDFFAQSEDKIGAATSSADAGTLYRIRSDKVIPAANKKILSQAERAEQQVKLGDILVNDDEVAVNKGGRRPKSALAGDDDDLAVPHSDVHNTDRAEKIGKTDSDAAGAGSGKLVDDTTGSGVAGSGEDEKTEDHGSATKTSKPPTESYNPVGIPEESPVSKTSNAE